MPDKMTIHFNVENGNTVSKFAVNEKGQITLTNDANAALTVTFPNGSPICKGKDPTDPDPIPANGSKQYQVCDGIAGASYKYTATVAGANPEDPIVIIEKSGAPLPIFNNAAAIFGAGLLVGIVIALAFRTFTRTRGPGPT